MSLIKNSLQFQKFIDVLPTLERDEVFYVTCLARSKYLTKEQREQYQMKNNISVHSDYVRSIDELWEVMERMESLWEGKFSTGRITVPEICLSTYMGINPSSMVKAYQNFISKMNDHHSQLITNVLNDTEPNWEAFTHMRRTMISEVAKATSRKSFIDIDIDNDDSTDVIDLHDRMASFLDNHGVEYSVLNTHSGYHFLIQKDTMNKGIPLYSKVEELNSAYSSGEVKFNSCAMVPVAGSLQGGHLVRIF